jgi:hypothetical protein
LYRSNILNNELANFDHTQVFFAFIDLDRRRFRSKRIESVRFSQMQIRISTGHFNLFQKANVFIGEFSGGLIISLLAIIQSDEKII